MRTLNEIDDEIEENAPLGNIGKVMDLVDEHGNTTDQMFYAIADGDYARMEYLQQFGMRLTDDIFVTAAIRNEQLLVIAYQVANGADIDKIIDIAEKEGKQLIWQWARCWKTVHAKNMSGKLSGTGSSPGR